MKKKNIILIVAAVVLVLVLLGSLGDGKKDRTKNDATEEVPTEAPDMFSVYFDCECESNLMMSRYDVELYVDETRIGLIPHGEHFTRLTELSEGEHTLVFYKSTDNSVKSTKLISVSGEMTVLCKVHCNSSSIDIKTCELLDGISGPDLIVPRLIGLNYKEAKAKLSEMGFVNIKTKTFQDAAIFDDEAWTVTDQLPEPGMSADKNDEILLTCEKPGYTFEEETQEESVKTDSESTESEKEPAEQTEDTTEVPEDTEQPTSETETPNVQTSENTAADSETIKDLIASNLPKVDGIEYTVEYDEDDGYSVMVTQKGLAEALKVLANYGSKEDLKSWETVVQSMRTMSQSGYELLITLGVKRPTFTVYILNDQNPENLLLAVKNGIVKYNVLDN